MGSSAAWQETRRHWDPLTVLSMGWERCSARRSALVPAAGRAIDCRLLPVWLLPLESAAAPTPDHEVVFLLNFFDELRRRVPPKK